MSKSKFNNKNALRKLSDILHKVIETTENVAGCVSRLSEDASRKDGTNNKNNLVLGDISDGSSPRSGGDDLGDGVNGENCLW